MVVEIFVTQSQGVDPLRDQVLEGVLDELRVTMIDEARGELLDDPGEYFSLPEQEAAPVGGNITAVKSGHDLARAESREIEVDCVGVVEWEFHHLGVAIAASLTPGAPIAMVSGYTVCHCRVSFPVT